MSKAIHRYLRALSGTLLAAGGLLSSLPAFSITANNASLPPSLTTEGTSVTTLKINGLPCVVDTVSGTLFCTLPTTLSFPATLSVDLSTTGFDGLTVDGNAYAPATQALTVDRFDGTHTLTLSTADGETLSYALVFTHLPIVCVDQAPTTIDRDKRPCRFSLVATAESAFDNEQDDIRERATIKIRGASSTVYPKKSYGIEICDENEDELDCPLLGLREDGDWILEALYSDYSKMRKQLGFDLWLAQCPSPVDDAKYPNGIRGRHVEVLLNGRWHGLYILSEKVDRKQLGIKKTKEDDATGALTVRGISFKGESFSDAIFLNGYEDAARTDTIEWQAWSQDYPDEDNLYVWDYLKRLIDFTAQAAVLDYEDFLRGAEERFDMDNVVDLLLFLQATNATDNCLKNTFLSTYNVQEQSKWFFTPWDLDATFGRMSDSRPSGVYGLPEVYTGAVKFFRRIYHSPLADRLKARWDELKTTVYAPDAVNARIEAYAELLVSSGAWARERQRWPQFCGEASDEVAFMEEWYATNYVKIDSALASLTTDIRAVPAAPEPAIATSDRQLSVSVPGRTAFTLTVYDPSGRTVARKKAKGALTLPLTPGAYVIRLTGEVADTKQKIIIR